MTVNSAVDCRSVGSLIETSALGSALVSLKWKQRSREISESVIRLNFS